jgi:Na+-translocating ferredoxin:NAD+ oxidoreductase RnfD subunit
VLMNITVPLIERLFRRRRFGVAKAADGKGA